MIVLLFNVLFGSVSFADLMVPADLGVSATVIEQKSLLSTNPEQVARAFLIREAAKLNLRPNLSDLKLRSIQKLPVGAVVRFTQVTGNTPIDGAGMIVTVNQGNVVSFVNHYAKVNGSHFQKSVMMAEASLTQEWAIKKAYQELKLTASPTFQTVQSQAAVIDGTLRPVYLIHLASPVDHQYDHELLVDANSGDILRSEELTLNDRDVIKTVTFDPNPTIKSGHAYGTVDGYEDNNSGDSAFFNSMMTPIELDHLTLVGDQYTLTGPKVTIVDLEEPTNANCDVSADNKNWNYTRSNPCFDAVSAYYFINKELTYLNDTLGFDVHPLHYEGGIKVDPNGVNGDDNSHYVPTQDYLAFGQGGVHDAQDHDVVIHELGHAIHNWLTHGQLSQVNGLSEGIGDYWAASYDRQFMKPDHVAYHWTFSYDGHNPFWDGRILNVSGSFPAAVQGKNSEIHLAGQLWATACMEIYSVIGKEKADKIFWTGIAMLSKTSGQNDAAKAYLAAAKQLYPNDSDLIQTVVSKFTARGYTVQ